MFWIVNDLTVLNNKTHWCSSVANNSELKVVVFAVWVLIVHWFFFFFNNKLWFNIWLWYHDNISILSIPIPLTGICVNNLGFKAASPFQSDNLYSLEQLHCNQLLLTFFCHCLAYMTGVQIFWVWFSSLISILNPETEYSFYGLMFFMWKYCTGLLFRSSRAHWNYADFWWRNCYFCHSKWQPLKYKWVRRLNKGKRNFD